jgi:hypothetical protein
MGHPGGGFAHTGGLVKYRQASASFLKKRSKKLLVLAGSGTGIAKSRGKQKFFGSFFKKEPLAVLPYAAFATRRSALY